MGRENKEILRDSVSVQWGYERIELSEKNLRSVIESFNKVIRTKCNAWIEVEQFNRDYRMRTKNTNFHCTLNVYDGVRVHTQDFGIYADYSWGSSLWDVEDSDLYHNFWDMWVRHLASMGIYMKGI